MRRALSLASFDQISSGEPVDIMLLQITHLRVVLGHEEGFAIRIQPRPSAYPPSGGTDHRYGDHSRAVLIPPVALDQHPARGQVQAGSQVGVLAVTLILFSKPCSTSLR